MAYNLQKGAVPGSVDQHGDQEIEGVKVFKSVISASVFYDTDAQSPCATENNVALRSLNAPVKNGIVVYDSAKQARTSPYFKLEGDVLIAQHAIITHLTGSGGGISDLQAHNIKGRIKASQVSYSNGIECHREALRIKAGPGVIVESTGVSLNLRPNGALNADSNQLTVNIKDSLSITERGQNLSDQDLLLVHDVNRNEVRHTTAQNFYDKYLSTKVPQPGGAPQSVQYRQGKEFVGSSNLTFEPKNSILAVGGTVSAPKLASTHRLHAHGEFHCNGAIYKTIKTVSDAHYEFQNSDHTVLLDPTEHKIVAILPPAKDNPGRVITVKRICGNVNKYKLVTSYSVVIRTEGETIDFSNEITLKSNYSLRTFHSDGIKWWITNRSGT